MQSSAGAMDEAEPGTDVNEELWQELSHALTDDSGRREMFALGLPIYYGERDTPEGLSVKEYPDGRRELVRFDRAGDEVIRSL